MNIPSRNMSSIGKMGIESCDDPSRCGKLGEYEAALEEVENKSHLNVCVHLYNNDRCKATCAVRKDCERALGAKFDREMRKKIPAARLLPMS